MVIVPPLQFVNTDSNTHRLYFIHQKIYEYFFSKSRNFILQLDQGYLVNDLGIRSVDGDDLTVLNFFFDQMWCDGTHPQVMMDSRNDGLVAVNSQNDIERYIIFTEMMSEPVFNGLRIVSISDEILSSEAFEWMIFFYRFRIVLPWTGKDNLFLDDRGEMIDVDVTEETILN